MEEVKDISMENATSSLQKESQILQQESGTSQTNTENKPEKSIELSGRTPKKRKASTECNGAWDAFYKYIQHEILQRETTLPYNFTLRLKGLAQNRKYPIPNHIAYDRQKLTGYGYEIALKTAQLCTPMLKKALSVVGKFQDEGHKENYILKVLENNIGAVAEIEYRKSKIQEERQSKTEEVAAEILQTEATADKTEQFQRRQIEKNKKTKYKELW